MIRITFRLWIN